MTLYGPHLYGPELYGGAGSTEEQDFLNEMARLRDSTPQIKVEHIAVDGTVTDISDYYESGGNFTREKERAPDEIQAGDFDITLINHDDYFSEYKAGSLFYGVQYHFSRIRISVGFMLPDGSTVLMDMCYGYIDELVAHSDESKVTLRCRDLMHRVIDENFHLRPSEETPTAGGTNVGNGTCSAINTKPFATVNESWTVTCTTPGADGVAKFSVVGTVSGSIGPATSGTEFSSTARGLKFTITAGATPWALNDAFTFQTFRHPEWTQENPAKIIWSVLTGYNYDANTVEAWADSVLDLDSTQDDANTDIDYESFVNAIDRVSTFTLTGFVDYNEGAQEFLENLLLLFLGSLYTAADGRITIRTWTPSFQSSVRVFADSEKMTDFGYSRTVNEIINHVRVTYKKTDSWEFSDEDVTYDGWYVAKDTGSITKYGKLSEEFTTRWYMSGGTHVEDFATRLLDRYAEPPLVIGFITGADGLLSEIGEKIYITDDKYGFTRVGAEISKITKNFDASPLNVEITARRDLSLDTLYGYLGSRIDEGDGYSPQASDWASATDQDKLFCYLGRGYKMY